jgi:Fe-S cluster biogenesis protein NfuA
VAKDALAQYVVNQAKGIVSSDGGDVQLTDVRGATAYVRYAKGHNPECLECVISPDDLRDFLTDMFNQSAPHITQVELEVVEAESDLSAEGRLQ